MPNEKGKFKRLALQNGWHVTEWEGSDQVDFVMQWATAEDAEEPTAAFSVKVVPINTAESGEETWVDIRNAGGSAGFLYGSCDMLAFEQEDRFIVVEREKLKKWVEDNVEKDYVTLAHQALMKVYKKPDGSMKTLVKTYHLKGLAEGEMRDGR